MANPVDPNDWPLGPERSNASDSPTLKPAPPASWRRPLSMAAGPIRVQGAEDVTAALAAALQGLEDETTQQAALERYTHGFHTYPGRLHPFLAQRLLEHFARAGDTVLDPFVGAGTSVLEAMLRGCRAVGTDINPIALRIARVRVQVWPSRKLEALKTLVQTLGDANFQDARRKVAPELSRVALSQRAWYQPHVLFELQALHDRILDVQDPDLQETCLLIFSSLLIKVSTQRSDSRQEQAPKQIGRGTTSRLFTQKGLELATGLTALAAAAPPETPAPILRTEDARRLPGKDDTVDLILTSPPYPGTYNYASHQDRRFGWLMESADFARSHEIGARADVPLTRAQWLDDEVAVLKEQHRVLKPGGLLILVVGDGVLEREAWRADRELPRSASEVGFRLLGMASQDRPITARAAAEVFDRLPRREHLLVFQKEWRR